MRQFGKGAPASGLKEFLALKGFELEDEDSPLSFRDEFSASNEWENASPTAVFGSMFDDDEDVDFDVPALFVSDFM